MKSKNNEHDHAHVHKKRSYKKPILEEQKTMMFMFESIRKSNTVISCRQCSSCHGCR